MKKLILPLSFAFIVSLLIHYFVFNTLNETYKTPKQQKSAGKKTNTQPNTITNVKFIKIKKPVVVEKKKVKKIPEKKPLKKMKKFKQPIKKPLPKRVKTIKIPKQEEKLDLKKLFTLEKEEILKQQKEKKEIQNEKQEIKKLDKLTQNYIKLYGKEYFSFSKEEKEYLKTNLNTIGKITQQYLRYPRLSARTGQSGVNILEFILHPNGDISDLKLIGSSNYQALDKNSLHTIGLAYKDYPKPLKPTKIKIYVQYLLY